jgi:hypothetical protein
MDESHWSGLLRPLFAGRRVIVKHEIVAGSFALVRAARSLGATDVFVLATNGPGTGPLPEPDEARWCSLGVSAAGGMLDRRHLAAHRRRPGRRRGSRVRSRP